MTTLTQAFHNASVLLDYELEHQSLETGPKTWHGQGVLTMGTVTPWALRISNHTDFLHTICLLTNGQIKLMFQGWFPGAIKDSV